MDSIERRLADAKLGAAIDNAMKRLPAQHKIRVVLSRGEYDVSVRSNGGRVVWFDGDLASAISDAVEWAENAG